MAGISASIDIIDHMTPILNNITSAMNIMLGAMESTQMATETGFDASAIAGVRDEIFSAESALIQYQEQLDKIRKKNRLPVPDVPVTSDAIRDFSWKSSAMPVFTNSGAERFQYEMNEVNSSMQSILQTQARISGQAMNMRVMPSGMMNDMAGIHSRMRDVQARIKEINNIPLDLRTGPVNNELEILRGHQARVQAAQDRLCAAMAGMDIGEINQAYLELDQAVNSVERNLRDNVYMQEEFNERLIKGQHSADGLGRKILGFISAYAGLQAVKNGIGASDDMVQTLSRLELMNDKQQSTQELFDMIYASAQKTYAPLMDTAAAIASMGNNARVAFSSNAELIAFMEQVNMQFVIGNASAQQQSNALLQLSQAMAAGALRGEELNSILDAAPGIARTIETAMGWAEGSIKSYAEKGEVTAEIVKISLLSMAEETEAAFMGMDMTFSKAMTNLQNYAKKAFQSVLLRINDIANSDGFNLFVENTMQAISVLATLALNVFEDMAAAGKFIAENWSYIEPIVLGVAAALAIYASALLIVSTIMTVNSIITGIHTLATTKWTIATFAQTVAQKGLNAALLGCPITWIVIAVIALIAVILVVCNAIARATGTVKSGFGIITGAINVAIQFFRNLAFVAGNVVLGIGEALGALAQNIRISFANCWINTQTGFLEFVNIVLTGVLTIIEWLNKIPGVSIDSSGIAARITNNAAEIASLEMNKGEYKDVAAAFAEGYSTLEAFEEGWVKDAFKAGTELGDNVAAFDLLGWFNKEKQPGKDNGDDNKENNYAADSANLANIADNTSDITDSIEITKEEIKYLKDIAEQDSINRLTTTEIKVDLGGVINQVTNNNDLDGMIDYLADSIEEQMSIMAEGVH